MYGLGPLLSLFDTEKFAVEQSFGKTIDQNIAELIKRKEEAQQAEALYQSNLQIAQQALASSKEGRQRLQGVELEYKSEQIVILNNTIQVLNELVRKYQQIEEILDEHISLLKEYKEDPEFEKKGFQVEGKSIYSIEDFQKINSAVMRLENTIKTLQERLDKTAHDAETLKKNLSLATQAVTDKKQEQAALKQQQPEDRVCRNKFTIKQQGTLLDAEERLLAYKQNLIEARLIEADRKAAYLEFSLRTNKLQLEVLQKQEDQVRSELRIDQKDIDAAKQALRLQRQKSNRMQEEWGRRVDSLRLVRQDELEKIKGIKERVGISDEVLTQYQNWSYLPSTVKEWNALVEIGRLNDYIEYDIAVRRDIYLAKIEQAKAQVTDKEVDNLIINTWHNLSTGVFDGASDVLAKEQKRYEKLRADLESTLASTDDKRGEATRLLKRNAQTAATIKDRLQNFTQQRQEVFASEPVVYKRLGESLQNEAFVESQKRSEYINQLIELYTSLIQERQAIVKNIDTMIHVLKSKAQSLLVPPLWNGVKKFVPDVGRFMKYLITPGRLQLSLQNLRISASSWFSTIRTNPSSLLLAILYLLAALVVYFFLRFYLLDIGLLITNMIPPEYGFIHLIAGFIAIIFQFIARSLNGLFIWTLLLIGVRAGMTDTYLSTLFYLLSIPFWLYYVYRFVRYARDINQARDYQFASAKYHSRFFFIISTLLSSTAILTLLREALVTVLPYSDAPRILQAVNFIIFQISLILLMSREQLLRLIPRYTTLGQWVQELVNQYYYLFLAGLIIIIVMSNPYIGYGTHFLYLILRVGLIMLLVPLIIMVHNKIKKAFASLFFEYDNEGQLAERFPYARTSYGLIIIGSFAFFSFLGILIAANIWGFQIGFKEVVSWLRQDLWKYTSPETGRLVAVNAIQLFRVIFYVALGVAIAFVINKFVFRRMFDLLMVDKGVQGIILSLTRYIIVVGAIIIGLQSIGGTSLLWYLLAIVGGLGWALKELVTDVFGYFLILIQRPIKIGDFIKINSDLVGVVRHLNLRSVVLRRKNSVTVLVPNSYLLTKPLTNWNYYRMYFAFPDISITVSYKADPEEVRKLFLKVLDDNYQVLRNPAPIVRLDNFTDNGFEFMVRGYLSHDKVLDQYDIASDIRLELVRTLRENAFDIGRPSRILQLVREDHISSPEEEKIDQIVAQVIKAEGDEQ